MFAAPYSYSSEFCGRYNQGYLNLSAFLHRKESFERRYFKLVQLKDWMRWMCWNTKNNEFYIHTIDWSHCNFQESPLIASQSLNGLSPPALITELLYCLTQAPRPSRLIFDNNIFSKKQTVQQLFHFLDQRKKLESFTFFNPIPQSLLGTLKTWLESHTLKHLGIHLDCFDEHTNTYYYNFETLIWIADGSKTLESLDIKSQCASFQALKEGIIRLMEKKPDLQIHVHDDLLQAWIDERRERKQSHPSPVFYFRAKNSDTNEKPPALRNSISW